MNCELMHMLLEKLPTGGVGCADFECNLLEIFPPQNTFL